MANKKVLLWFLSFMLVYFLVRGGKMYIPNIPDFFKYHLTDLLFVPTTALLGLLGVRVLKRDNTLTISLGLVSALIVLVSFYFEWYLPTYKQHIHPYTSDRVDVLMYCLGGLLFLCLQKKYL